MAGRWLAKNGLAAFRAVQRMGYEGLVAKNETAPYVAGRSNRWCKVKVRQAGEFVVGGFTEGAAGVSSLLVGVYQNDGLRYIGEVEFGFSPADRAALWRQLQRITATRSPFANLRGKRGATWVAPRLMAAVTFQEWMEGYVRHPSELFGGTLRPGTPSGESDRNRLLLHHRGLVTIGAGHRKWLSSSQLFGNTVTIANCGMRIERVPTGATASMTDLVLHFNGPFSFTDGYRCVFHSRFADSPGIYWWARYLVPKRG